MNKDVYFLRIAKEVAKASKCFSRKIGSVLVKDGCIISTGYNGPAKGVKHCNERLISFYESIENKKIGLPEGSYPTSCPRRYFDYKSGHGLQLCQAAHSERNAILQAARNGISTIGTTLYAYCGRPCKDCAIEIVNAGIKEIVCLETDSNSGDYDEYSKLILEEGGVKIKRISKRLLDETN